MAKVKGQNLRVFVGGKTIAAALQCDLNVQMQVQPLSTKDDAGSWTRNVAVGLTWNVKANGVVTSDAGRNDTSELMAMTGTVVDIELGIAGGTNNSEKENILLTGKAILSDVQITAPNQQRSTYDVQFTGVRNLLFPLTVLVTSDNHALETTDGHVLICWTE